MMPADVIAALMRACLRVSGNVTAAVLLIVTVEIVLVSRYITAIFAVLVFLSVAIWFPLLWFIPLIANVNVRAAFPRSRRRMPL
jgi:hypothetical protein